MSLRSPHSVGRAAACRIGLLAATAGLALTPASASAADCATTTTYSSAGTYACSVPAGADVAFVGATGGHGSGANGSDGGAPGDYVAGWYFVGPGQGLSAGTTLQTVVGSSNSGRTAPFGGGGSGGTGAQADGGAGGGASSVSTDDSTLVIAGGGGGGGGGNLEGPFYTNTTFNGGAGGGPGGGGAQGAGMPYMLDGFNPGGRLGGMGGGGANGGNAGGGGPAYSSYYPTVPPSWPTGNSGGGLSGGDGGGGGNALAGGGGGGGGYAGGGGGGGGSDIVRQQEINPPQGWDYYADVRGEVRDGAGGGGGGSDLVRGAVTNVAQRTDTTGSSSVQLRFEPAKPLSLVASPAPASSCSTVRLFVAPDSTTTLTGTVTVTEGSRTVASNPVRQEAGWGPGGIVTFDAALSSGTHQLVATYSGDEQNAPRVSAPISVSVAGCEGPSTTTLASSKPSADLCAPVTLTATVSGSAPTGTVTFRDGSDQIGQAAVDASGHAAMTTATLTAGSHSIIASYGGDNSIGGDQKNAPSASAALTQTIVASGPGAGCSYSFAAGAIGSVPVPPDATSMTVTALGGSGASTPAVGNSYGLRGGAGASVTATIPVGGSSPVAGGSTLTVAVGADGNGWQATTGGGGAGGRPGAAGGGGTVPALAGGAGGGASRISVGQTPVLVAAGGGGAGSGDPAASGEADSMSGPGGLAGRDADSAPFGSDDELGAGGGGASAGAAGVAASARNSFPFEGAGSPGTAGNGAQGGTGGSSYGGLPPFSSQGRNYAGGGGGGGGGLYGGGAGDPGAAEGGGGGGGSSFVTPAASAQAVTYNYWQPPTLSIQFSAPASSRATARAAGKRATPKRPKLTRVSGRPKLTGVRRSTACITVAGTKDARPRSLRVGYRLSKGATVTFRLRRSRNARIRTHCAPTSRSRQRWTPGQVRQLRQPAGRHSTTVDREHGKLQAGSYQLTVFATDDHGQRSVVRRLRFAVIQ